MHVYKAINAVQADLAKEGIGKDRKNVQQGYSFRGIDDVYNSVSPLLAKHGLCILPRVTSRDVVERVNAKGTALFYVTVGAEFDFVASEDGSKHTVVTYGEAMDSGDKATNKAMSAAYKYACMQAFAIPTEGDNDADSTTHVVQAVRPAKAAMEGETYTPEQQARMQSIASALVDFVTAESQGEDQSYGIWELVEPLTNEEKLLLWNLLADQSKVRARVKVVSQAHMKKAA